MNLSKALHAQLLDGIEEIGFEVSPESLAALETHLALLLKWRTKMNLVSITAERELITHHALDSLVMVPILNAPGSTHKKYTGFRNRCRIPRNVAGSGAAVYAFCLVGQPATAYGISTHGSSASWNTKHFPAYRAG